MVGHHHLCRVHIPVAHLPPFSGSKSGNGVNLPGFVYTQSIQYIKYYNIILYVYIYIHHYNIPILPLPLYIDGYSGWTGPQDEGEELEVVFQIPPSTGKKDVKIEFRRQEIRMLKPEVNVWKTKTWGDEIMGYSI
jgi:hypothetical protein